MAGFLWRRFLQSLPVIFGVTTIVFLLLHFIPGDPVEIMLGETADAADRDSLRKLLGLDQNLLEQYFLFWKNLLVGGWGESIVYQKSVLGLIWERFPPTLVLAASALSVALLLSIPLGMAAARRAGGSVDVLSVGFSLAAASIPIFVLVPVIVLLFSVELRWFSVSGFGSWKDLVLPALCLGVGISGFFTRLIRTSVLEVMNEDYILTARSKGVREWIIFSVHILRNALIPLVTVLGTVVGSLLAGAVITETLFDWPGIGRLFYGAFQSRDYPFQGIVLWVSLTYITINFLIDLLYSLIDPRVRRE
jgi:peptide/nickel transport system permease protein